MQGVIWEECQGSGLNQASREPQESDDSQVSAFIGGKSEVYLKRSKRTSLLNLNSLGHSQGWEGRGTGVRGQAALSY